MVVILLSHYNIRVLSVDLSVLVLGVDVFCFLLKILYMKYMVFPFLLISYSFTF